MRVRTHNDLNQWLKFFLTGVIETARQGIVTFDGILQLQNSLNERLKSLGTRMSDALKVIEHLYSRPIATAQDVARITGKSNVSAYKLIAELENRGVLREITGGQRGKVYLFQEYMDLFKTGDHL